MNEGRGREFASIDEIVEALRVPSPQHPTEALRAAERARGQINELLIDLVDTTRREVLEGRYPEDNAHIFAMLLLAEFEETRAFEVISGLFALPEDLTYDLVGDFLTEDLPRVLASVCGGRIGGLAGMVEDRSRGGYVRGAALSAIVALVQRRIISREQAADYLRVLVRERLDREPSPVWDEAGNVVLDLYVQDLFGDIRRAIREGLIGRFMMTPDDVDKAEREGLDVMMALLDRNRHLHPVRDVVAETQWWACFEEDDRRGHGTPDSAHGADLYECDDPHCVDHAGAMVPFRRESPKVGRNDPCPCGSGKKYKKCCLRTESSPIPH